MDLIHFVLVVLIDLLNLAGAILTVWKERKSQDKVGDLKGGGE